MAEVIVILTRDEAVATLDAVEKIHEGTSRYLGLPGVNTEVVRGRQRNLGEVKAKLTKEIYG